MQYFFVKGRHEIYDDGLLCDYRVDLTMENGVAGSLT